MDTDQIIVQLTEGTVLESPHWTEPVSVLMAKKRGSRVETRYLGLPPVFRADHPFVFMIRDNRSDAILFAGRIMNPLE